ncbi:MAG: NAD(P)/FAD-dependent oxidoreductase, partial [Bacteroidetes bacterium]|nr:NAD(P)/FAD-dependent oxidoreductase [Bacteroidota bacterium]
MSTTILVLGAGTGGIITANQLCKKVCNDGEINPVKIIVFEKEEKNVFAPSLLWLMVGKRKPEQIYRDTNKIAGNGIEVVLGEIEKVNPETKTVTVKGKEYKGDYMVISLGVEQ